MNKKKIKTFTICCFFTIVFLIILLVFRMGIALFVENFMTFLQNTFSLSTKSMKIIGLVIGIPLIIITFYFICKDDKKL